MPRPRPAPPLTSSALADFLSRLAADESTAGEKYQQLRLRLRWYFDRQSCTDPDELVDQTIDRAVGKISNGATIPNLSSFLFGIARLAKDQAEIY